MYIEPEQLEALTRICQQAPRYQDALLTRLYQWMDKIEDPVSRKLVWKIINEHQERHNAVLRDVQEVLELKAQLEREHDG